MILIGSQAAKLRGIDLGRAPGDVDVIVYATHVRALVEFLRQSGAAFYVPPPGKPPMAPNHLAFVLPSGQPRPTYIDIEVVVDPEHSSSKLIQLCRDEPDAVVELKPGVTLTAKLATPEALLLLKTSHRYKRNSPHFAKTMRDIHAIRHAGIFIPDELKPLLRQREKETYVYKHPNLMVKKTDFFTGDGVHYTFDHDSIHEAVAVGDRPAYREYSIEGQEVFCSKEKFFAGTERSRLLGVLEESYVLALERSQIPHRGKCTPRQSFDMALQKVCTSITSGWFREYAWENFHQVRKLYDDSYADRFWAAVEAGRVKRFIPTEQTQGAMA